eukprot:scaffold4282_cov112-Cylindrotheca_fusiformis.AAC.11
MKFIISSQGKPSPSLLSRQEGKRAKELLQQPQQGIHIQSWRKGGSTPAAALLNDSIKCINNNRKKPPQQGDTMKANCFDNTVSPRWQASQGMKAIDFPPGEEIDRMVAQAMLELSAEEREKALEEIHGVVEVDEEDPDFMASCLDEMDNCLAATKSGTAYELAEQMNYDYVSNNRFRTMFLRSTRYEPQDAAEKLIGFLDYKRELFGVENLVHDITLDDLSPDDRALMEVGYVQFGKTHDRNGRPILCTCEKVKLQHAKSAENSVRDDDFAIATFVGFNVLNAVFYFVFLAS